MSASSTAAAPLASSAGPSGIVIASDLAFADPDLAVVAEGCDVAWAVALVAFSAILAGQVGSSGE